MLSISTSFNVKSRLDVRTMLEELKSFGLEYIEIGYHFKPDKLEEIISLLKPLGLKVSSVHNFCPCPDEPPTGRHISNYFRMSALDESERDKAVVWTKRAVDTAVRVGAKFVVIHAGMVEIDELPYNILSKMFEEGKSGTDEFLEIRRQYLQLRKEKSPPHVAAVQKSLEEVLTYALSQHVSIGLETRFYPNEIPNFEEVGYFLKLFATKGLVYWHDTGHAQAQNALGLIPHEAYFKHYRNFLAGMHIHDCRGVEDHLAPFTADINFDKIFASILSDICRVVEAHPPATMEQIKAAVARLRSMKES